MPPSAARVASQHVAAKLELVALAQRVVARLGVDSRWEVQGGHSPYPPVGYGARDSVTVSLSFADGYSGSGASGGTRYTPIPGARVETERVAEALRGAGLLHVEVKERLWGIMVTAWPPEKTRFLLPVGWSYLHLKT